MPRHDAESKSSCKTYVKASQLEIKPARQQMAELMTSSGGASTYREVSGELAGSGSFPSEGVAAAAVADRAAAPSFVRKQPTSSGARSEITMPSETMNLQLKIGRA